MFWGGNGPNEASHLVECHRTINAVKYSAIVQDNLFQTISTINDEEGRRLTFQHDNRPPHKVEKNQD